MQKHGEKDKMRKREKYTYTEGAKASVGKHTDIKREGFKRKKYIQFSF
jgi:hypothetical protein